MIELNALWVVLMLEALVALILLVVIVFMISKKRNNNSHTAAKDLIEKLENSESDKIEKLEKMLSSLCEIEADKKEAFVAQIWCSERSLYQQIIQLFITGDAEKLKEMERYIEQLSEPYSKLLKYASGGGEADQVKQAEKKIEKLTEEREQLAEQLTAAMNTMDEISAEYTRVFSGTQTELELKNSSSKMMEIFRQAEQQARKLRDST